MEKITSYIEHNVNRSRHSQEWCLKIMFNWKLPAFETLNIDINDEISILNIEYLLNKNQNNVDMKIKSYEPAEKGQFTCTCIYVLF